MHFIEELRTTNIPLILLAGFAQGRRIRILMVTQDENEAAMRSFLKSQGLRAKQGRLNFAIESRGITPLGQLDQWTAAGADLRSFADFPTSPISGRETGFLFVEEWLD
jgi:hypothetical protein